MEEPGRLQSMESLRVAEGRTRLSDFTFTFHFHALEKEMATYSRRCPGGERPLVELYFEPGVFSERCTEKLPLRVDFIHRVEFGDRKSVV